MKKINPIKKWYYDSIREIEIKSGETMSAAARKRFLVSYIICTLIIGYLAFVMLIQPISMHILGIEPDVPPVSVHLMKNHSFSSVVLLEDKAKNRDEIVVERYKSDDSMYYILTVDEEKCKDIIVYGGDDGEASNTLEIKRLEGNQYYFEFIKSKRTVRYRIIIKTFEGEKESYIWSYNSK